MSAAHLWRAIKDSGDDLVKIRNISVSRIPTSVFVFFLFAFLSSMLTTQFTYVSPLNADYSSMKIDFAFHAGIINALAQGFPPQDPWVFGRTIQYHFFTEMLYAIPVRLFSVNSEDILMSFTPYIISPVFSVSLYSFFKEFANKKERAGLYCLATHFSNMFMIKSFASSWFLYHIYSNINNAGMGLSCMLVLLVLLKNWDNEKQGAGRKEIFVFAMLVMLATGIKGPVAIVLVAALLGTLILGLILRKINKGIVAVTGITVISFVTVYVYILGAQYANEGGGRLFNPWEVTDIFFIKGELMEAFPGTGLGDRIAVLAVFICLLLTAFTIPFAVAYVREFMMVVSGKKDFNFSRVTVYAASLVGLIAMLLLNYSGHSQVYFGFVTCALVPVIVFWYFEDTETRRNNMRKIAKLFFTVGMCFTVFTSFVYITDRAESSYSIYNSRNNNSDMYRSVSLKEYKGLIWLKNNTESEALIASDRYYSIAPEDYDVGNRGHNTHFLYAVYSMRRHYLEGSGFSLEAKDTELRKEMLGKNMQFFDINNADRGKAAKELGIDYVLVSKRFNKAGDLSSDEYVKCFSNDEMDIYKVE